MAIESDDLTIQILREIRDEVRATNQRLDQTNLRLDQTRLELGERLDHVETTLLDLAEQQRFVVRYVKALAERDAHIDLQVAELRVRVDKIESRIGAEGR